MTGEPDRAPITPPSLPVLGLLLAGGRSTRMGRDKALLPLGGVSLIQRATDTLRPQVAALAISANGDPGRFAFLDLPVLPDGAPSAGPLSGLLAGLHWAAGTGRASHLAIVACDTPFFPRDLVVRLLAATRPEDDRIVVPRSGGRAHPVFGLFSITCRDPLAHWLAEAQNPAMHRWIESRPHVYADITDDPDPFFNVNTPEDLVIAARRLACPSER